MKSIKYLKIRFENCEVYRIFAEDLLHFSYKKSFNLDKYDFEKKLLSIKEDDSVCEIRFFLDASLLNAVNMSNFDDDQNIINRIQQNDVVFYELCDENDELFETIEVPFDGFFTNSLQKNKFQMQENGGMIITISH